MGWRLRTLIVGGGQMGSSLISGLLGSGSVDPSDLGVAEPRAEARDELSGRFPGIGVSDLVQPSESVVLAVKPGDVDAACAEIVRAGVPDRLMSIAAGVTIGGLESRLDGRTAVLRAMPNIPALLGAGASALAGGSAVDEKDFVWAEAVLSSLGVVARVPEHLLDAVTGLSGSGPAYVFLLAEAMIEAGVAEGLDRDVSALLVTHTVLGAGRLLVETGESADHLSQRVSSPGGTTVAGLGRLEEGGLRALVRDAVAAAATRSRELALSLPGQALRPVPAPSPAPDPAPSPDPAPDPDSPAAGT
ncbi:MAG: pyrroline-5-carboxylate reductase [Acidimicrobiales bacterium]